MQEFNKQDPKIIQDAVRLLKSQFVEVYTKLGYERLEVSVGWHTMRMSPKGREIAASIYHGASHLQAATFISDVNEEVKERQKKKSPTAVEEKKKDEIESNNNQQINNMAKGDKAKQAKDLIEKGETNPDVLVEKIGLSKIYAKTLIGKYGQSTTTSTEKKPKPVKKISSKKKVEPVSEEIPVSELVVEDGN